MVGAVPVFDAGPLGGAPPISLPDPSALMAPILNANAIPANIADLLQPNSQVNQQFMLEQLKIMMANTQANGVN